MKAVMLVVAVLTTSLVGWSVALPSSPTQTPSMEDLEARLSQKTTIADLITYAYEKNPSILAARMGWEAVIENYRVVTGYPDPELMVTYYPDPIETRLGPQDLNATISQKIPFPGKLSKTGEVVEAEARIAKLKLDQTVRDVIVSIRESYYELLYIRHGKRVADQNMKLLEHLRKVAETNYARNHNTLLDIVKAQSQTGQLRYDILLLEDLEKTEIARLNGLLSRPPGSPVGELQKDPIPSISFSLEEIYSLAEANQEEIKMANVRVEKAEKEIELARYEALPDFKIGLFYADIGNPDVMNPPSNAGTDALGIQTGMSLPLWFGKNKGRTERARAEMRKAEAAKNARVNDTNAQIRALYFRLENARRLTDLYRNELLPQAAKAMEIGETWFREGQSTFSDFIEAQAVWYNFQLALARALADYGKYLARLERLVGHSLTVENSASPEGTGKEAK